MVAMRFSLALLLLACTVAGSHRDTHAGHPSHGTWTTLWSRHPCFVSCLPSLDLDKRTLHLGSKRSSSNLRPRSDRRTGVTERALGITTIRNARGPAGAALMLSREAVCGLWTLKYSVEDEHHEATVWLEEAGNMRPMDAKNISGGSVQPSAGRWSLTQSTVMLYYRKPGELSHSWAGRLVEQPSNDTAENISRSIRDGVIQQGDSDPEFLGRFEAVQKLPTFTAEELRVVELGRQRAPVPRFAMENIAGRWSLQGGLYEQPVILSPVILYPDGRFEAVPDFSHRFAGRWGLHRDNPEESLQENREQASSSGGARREGTHLWLWAQRSECLGFNMNADYRFVGRITPSGLDDHLQLSIAQKSAEEAAAAAGKGTMTGYAEFAAPSSIAVEIQGSIFWGNIADMEYSDLAGNFSMKPLRSESRASDEE